MNRTDVEYIIEKLEFYRFRARSTIISGKENKHERDNF